MPSSAMVRNLPSRPGGTRVPRDLHLRRRMRASLEGAMRGAQERSSLGVMAALRVGGERGERGDLRRSWDCCSEVSRE